MAARAAKEAKAAMATTNINSTLTGMSVTGNITVNAQVPNSGYYTTGAVSTIGPLPNIIGSNYASGYTISTQQPTSTIVFNNNNNQEIVRLNKDGSVTWANGINVDEAADAFSKSLQLGGERSVGITQGVKQRMRDTVFEEIIELARIKGTLNANDLTYMLSAAKIMDKLKGGYE